jgi:hypothetical protein
MLHRQVSSESLTARGRLDRKAVTTLYNALSDLEIKTQQRRDLIGRVAHLAARTMIKKLILPLHDPTVRKVVHGVDLLLSLSHDLHVISSNTPVMTRCFRLASSGW